VIATPKLFCSPQTVFLTTTHMRECCVIWCDQVV
jgi:hypothetical protein